MAMYILQREKTKSLILFGDSLITGAGATDTKSSCSKILKSALNIPIYIKSRSNDTTREALHRLDRDIIGKTNSLYVLVLFGNNDCRLIDIDKPIVQPQEFKANMEMIINKIKSDAKVPIICNLQPIDSKKFYLTLPEMKKFMHKIKSPYEWQKQYSDLCEEVANICNIAIADIRLALEHSSKPILAEDGLHPNDEGHAVIAQVFLNTLNQVIDVTKE